MVNIENLIRLATLVRDETANKQNTALRVGGTFLEVIYAIRYLLETVGELDTLVKGLDTRTRFFHGSSADVDALKNKTDLGVYVVTTTGWTGLLSVQFDFYSTVSQVALSSSTPDYSEGSLAWKPAPCVMFRTYTDGAWSQWQPVSGGGDLPIKIVSDAVGDFDLSDEAGFVLLRCENGHIRTQNFYSGNIYTKGEVDRLIGSGGGVTQKQLQDGLATKQDKLVSGTNIKTINGSSILGSGNITISGGEGTTSKRVIKILSVGNSYSADAFMYFPYVFRNVATDLDVIIGIASIGSSTVQLHLENANSGSASYYFYKWTSTDNKWTSTSSKTLEYCVTNEDWDFITFQQKSTNSADYTTISPYLNPLIDWVFGKVTKAVKIGWLMTPALPRGNSGLQPYNYSSDTFYASLVTTAQSILNDTPVSFVIPEGTAIQNCRKTSLCDLGDYTYHYMSQDGVHLQQGLPCLAASYACVQYILDMIGYTNKGILGDSIRPTDSKDDTWNILSQQGNCVGVTDANCLLAQKCVLMAIKKPYEITNCGTLFES